MGKTMAAEYLTFRYVGPQKNLERVQEQLVSVWFVPDIDMVFGTVTIESMLYPEKDGMGFRRTEIHYRKSKEWVEGIMNRMAEEQEKAHHG
jgi:hypothetical protein